MKKKESLNQYKAQRDFTKTPEPKGAHKQAYSANPIFVIQKHYASHLHYDMRLEINGVLKSWAVPKGPSTDPSVKRLAIPTEDHPIEYATFEGVIPEGQYGAGTVMVWDIGTYENIKHSEGKPIPMLDCYLNGRIEVFLHGKKLTGAYTLIRLEQSTYKQGGWLLIKMRDDYVKSSNILTRQPRSALTDRNMTQIRKGSPWGK
jgi:DNA ligase D-like protein (predicted 3'-phosphoesterase)